LQIGVGDEEVDALDAGLDHAVDRVAAAAADADDLDARARGRRLVVDEHSQAVVRLTAIRCHSFTDSFHFGRPPLAGKRV
jgi:hypothetical protein